MTVFWSDLITMVSEWNYSIFMQIYHPRWPLAAVTKTSINMKMIISQEPLVEIQHCVKMFLVWSRFDFLNGTTSDLCKLTVQDGAQGLLLKIA